MPLCHVPYVALFFKYTQNIRKSEWHKYIFFCIQLVSCIDMNRNVSFPCTYVALFFKYTHNIKKGELGWVFCIAMRGNVSFPCTYQVSLFYKYTQNTKRWVTHFHLFLHTTSFLYRYEWKCNFSIYICSPVLQIYTEHDRCVWNTYCNRSLSERSLWKSHVIYIHSPYIFQKVFQ